jgi:hypothetical protein
LNRVIALLLASAGGLASWGCSPTDATVAYEKVVDGGIDGAGCQQSSDCAEGFYCSKTDCLVDGGTCQGRPAVSDCSNELQLGMGACGCDGVEYWNSCLRRAAGVNAAPNCLGLSTSPCQSSAECPGADAGSGAVCAKILGCNLPGICWVLPTSCPSDTIYTFPFTFQSCGAPGTCVDFCAAIKSEEPMSPCTAIGPDQ